MTVSRASAIAAVHGSLPPYRYRQEEITDAFAAVLDDPEQEPILRRLHASTQVRNRNLVLPLERYGDVESFGKANDAFLEHAVTLGAAAVEGALQEAAVPAEQVDLIASTTVTGIAVPSIEARIAERVGLRPDVKRVPLFGLGCVAGVAGVALLHDYLRGAPDDVAVLVAAELCSLTAQYDDHSLANIIACGLFGDGAAAVVALGAARARADAEAGHPQHAGPAVLDSLSHLYPDTERMMGWDVSSSGLTIVLDADIPELVEQYLADDVQQFLADHDLKIEDIGTWVCHPGGPKVIEAVQEQLRLPASALELTWQSLADVGNLSSASVLYVLRDTIRTRPAPGTLGVLLAMGPGFSCEMVLLRWP